MRDFYYQSPDALNGVCIRVYWNGGSFDPKAVVYTEGRIQGTPIGTNVLNAGKVFYAKNIQCKSWIRKDVEQAVRQYLAESNVRVGDLIKEEYCMSIRTKYGEFGMQCMGIPGDGTFQYRAFLYSGGEEFNTYIRRDIKSRESILALTENAASYLFHVPPQKL